MKILVKMCFLFFIFMLAIIPVPSNAENEEANFTKKYSDFNTKDDNFVFVNYLLYRNLISGFSDGTLKPLAPITRAEAVEMMMKAADYNNISENPFLEKFKDVEDKHWASKSIHIAFQEGIIHGYPDGTFRPENKLTRAEGIALVLSLSKGIIPKEQIPNINIADVQRSFWASNPILVSLQTGMASFRAKKQRQFAPHDIMTRGEFMRALAVLLSTDPEFYKVNLFPEVRVVQGQAAVLVQKTQATKKLNAKENTILNLGDVITASSNSIVEINFPDGSGLLLKNDTKLSYLEGTGRSYIKTDGKVGTAVEWLNLKLEKGTMFGALAANNNETEERTKISSKLKEVLGDEYLLVASKYPVLPTKKEAPPWWKQSKVKRVKVKVDMPTSVAAVRGTFWKNTVTAEASRTSLLTGDLQVIRGNDKVSLDVGQVTEVTSKKGKPLAPVPMNITEQKEWMAESQWTLNKAREIKKNREIPYSLSGTGKKSYTKATNFPTKYIQPLLQEIEYESR